MREALVSIRDRDGTALGLDGALEVFHEGGIEDVEVLSCEGSRGVARVRVAGAIDATALDDLETIEWWERVAGSDDGPAYLVEFDALAEPDGVDGCADDLVLCGATAVDEDSYVFDVTGPQDAIAETVERYRDAGADVRLESLRDYQPGDEPLERLTERQQEVLSVAFDAGYFDVPRTASTEDVAAELDLDTSTVSEHLQRAERNLLSDVLAETA